MKQRIRDRRRFPFFQVTKADLEALKDVCEAPGVTVKLSSVRSVYFALLEIANDARSDSTELTRGGLAAHAGVSSRTAFDASQIIQDARLLEIDRQPGETSIWTLCSVEDDQLNPGSHCQTPRQPLPGSMETGQEEGETPLPPKGDVEEIFEHWQKVMGKPRTNLDPDRRRRIKRALTFATVGEIKQAIDGCAGSDWHMKRGQYRDREGSEHSKLSLILRDREMLETFIERAGALTHVATAHEKEAQRVVLTAHQMPHSPQAQERAPLARKYLEDRGWRIANGEAGRPVFVPPTA